MIDIDELRDPVIGAYGLEKVDAQYTFYYDETNNISKLHIGTEGLNVSELKVFVLGGVVHHGEPRTIEIGSLRDAMKIQKSAREIKLKHVAKGDFLDLLKSNKLTTFLRWIGDNGLMIHYHDLDPFYWSIVDIIDSILASELCSPLHRYHALLKSDLTEALRNDVANTIDLFHRYDYPGLASEAGKPFLDELIELLKRNGVVLQPSKFQMLMDVLQFGRKLDTLVFIEDNPPLRLIETSATSTSIELHSSSTQATSWIWRRRSESG